MSGDGGSSSGFVRPFVITGGRTHADVELRLESMLAVTPGAWRTKVDPDLQRLVDACAEPQSVAELAVSLELAVGVVKVLAGDLLDAGVLTHHEASRPVDVDISLLERILDGVRSL